MYIHEYASTLPTHGRAPGLERTERLRRHQVRRGKSAFYRDKLDAVLGTYVEARGSVEEWWRSRRDEVVWSDWNDGHTFEHGLHRAYHCSSAPSSALLTLSPPLVRAAYLLNCPRYPPTTWASQ